MWNVWTRCRIVVGIEGIGGGQLWCNRTVYRSLHAQGSDQMHAQAAVWNSPVLPCLVPCLITAVQRLHNWMLDGGQSERSECG